MKTEQNRTYGPDPKRVFLVHGRNEDARKAMSRFLRAIGLDPLEWVEAVNLTGKTAPFVGEVLSAGFAAAQAVVVLLTGDDFARVGKRFGREQLMPQPRPNVLFEAGMALGLFPNRTILVQIGENRPFTDIAGRHYISMSDASEKRHELVQRLASAGCAVNTPARQDWLTEGNFNSAVVSPDGQHQSFEVSRRASALFTVIICIVAVAAIRLIQSLRPTQVLVSGEIVTARPITLYIVGIPNFQYTLQKSNKVSIAIPVLPHFTYLAEYVTDGRIVEKNPLRIQGTLADLGIFRNYISPPVPVIKPDIQDTDDDIRHFLQ